MKTSKTKDTAIYVRVSNKTREKLKQKAEKQGATVSSLVNLFIEKMLANQ